MVLTAKLAGVRITTHFFVYIKQQFLPLQFQVKQTNAKQTKQGEIESKGTVAPGGSIQVVQKGEKEVLTLRKPPNNAVVNTNKPDIKAKADEVIEKKLKPDASVKQTQDKSANRTGGTGIKVNDVSI